jgi:hypothetical protein
MWLLSNWCPSVCCGWVERDKSKRTQHDLVDKEIQGRVDANRRFVDEVLEEIQDENRYSTF